MEAAEQSAVSIGPAQSGSEVGEIQLRDTLGIAASNVGERSVTSAVIAGRTLFSGTMSPAKVEEMSEVSSSRNRHHPK